MANSATLAATKATSSSDVLILQKYTLSIDTYVAGGVDLSGLAGYAAGLTSRHLAETDIIGGWAQTQLAAAGVASYPSYFDLTNKKLFLLDEATGQQRAAGGLGLTVTVDLYLLFG